MTAVDQLLTNLESGVYDDIVKCQRSKIERLHDAEFKLWLFGSSRLHYEIGSPEQTIGARACHQAAYVHGVVEALLRIERMGWK